MDNNESNHRQRLQIFIDDVPHLVEHTNPTGQELCDLLSPPANEVWLDVPDAADRLIEASQTVALEAGMHFYTARKVTIELDRAKFRVPAGTITETELRNLPAPPVAENREILREDDHDEDQPLGPNEIVEIKEGDRFFTAPRRINPGAWLR